MRTVRKRACISPSRRGYSLIELMIALALVGIVLASAGAMLLQAYAGENAYREQNEAQRSARAAVDIVSDDLRAARSVPPFNGTPTLSAPLLLSVYNKYTAPRPVRYWINGTDLMRTVGGTAISKIKDLPSRVVASNITGLTITHTNAQPLKATVIVIAQVPASQDERQKRALAEISTVQVRAELTIRNSLL